MGFSLTAWIAPPPPPPPRPLVEEIAALIKGACLRTGTKLGALAIDAGLREQHFSRQLHQQGVNLARLALASPDWWIEFLPEFIDLLKLDRSAVIARLQPKPTVNDGGYGPRIDQLERLVGELMSPGRQKSA